MTTLTNSTAPQDQKLRATFLVLQGLIASTLLYFVTALYLTITTGTWQSVTFTIIAGVAEILVFVDISLVRRGQVARAGWLLLGMNSFGAISAAVLFVNLGYVAVAYVLITNYFVIRYLLSAQARRSGWIITATALLISIFAEFFNPAWRQSAQLLLTLAPIITTLLGAAFLIVVSYESWGRSVRNKLLVAFMGSTLVTAGILSVYLITSTTNTLRQELERQLGQHTNGIAVQISALFNEQVTSLTSLSLNDILQTAASNANNSYEGDASAIESTLKARDEQWQAADAAGNDNDPLVQRFLQNAASKELVKFQNTFPTHVELFITDLNGGLVAATNRTSDYYQADEAWWKAAYNNGQGAAYISEPKYDQSAGIFGIQIALPIRDGETNQLVGIIRTTYQTTVLANILGEEVGETGETILYIPGRPAFVFHQGQLDPMDPNTFNELQALLGQGMIEMDYENEGAVANAGTSDSRTPSVVMQTSMKELGDTSEFNKLGWVVAYHQSQSEAYAPISANIRGAVIVIVIVVLLVLAGAYALSSLLVRPIAQLTRTAEEIASGNLSSRAEASSTDEIGILANTFNRMTSQLQDTLKDLEHRVAARTRDLAIVAEVGTATATILESKRLLQEVVDLTKERFHLYHSHIYLLDNEAKNLVLTAGAGEPGRIMVAEGRSIPLDREQSLVARAARERKGVTVNDVTEAPDFLANPLLPDTRSELAVPMIVGGKVIGVFDIQSEQVGRFTESDVNIQTTLAAQLATSIQNVRSFEQSRKQAELESLVNVIGQKIQSTTSIEETLQTAIRELGTAIGASRVKATISASSGNGSTKTASTH